MADPDETEVETDDQSPKGLRAKLESTLAENSDLKGSLADASQKLAFYDAGLGHLSEQQRSRVLLIAKSESRTGGDDLKSIAEELSYTKPAPAAGEVPPVQEVTVEEPAHAAELSELARLAAGAPGPGSPQAGALDLSEYTSNDELKKYLMTVVDDSFGPTLE